MNAFIEELKWRGLYADMMPGTDEQLNKEMTTAYIGFNPYKSFGAFSTARS
jgi:tyrosyl-tRNA synthetase